MNLILIIFYHFIILLRHILCKNMNVYKQFISSLLFLKFYENDT